MFKLFQRSEFIYSVPTQISTYNIIKEYLTPCDVDDIYSFNRINLFSPNSYFSIERIILTDELINYILSNDNSSKS